MKPLLVLILVFYLAKSQTVSRVRVVNHREYFRKVLQETVYELEHREWCNLKLPDFVVPINETVFDHRYEGTVTYANGFVVSIQELDIVQSSVQQFWSWNNTLQVGTISLHGMLRMTGLALGYDVIAEMETGEHRYTAIYTHPLISYMFRILHRIESEYIDSVTVVAERVPKHTAVIPDIFPKDMTSDVLTSLFDSDDTAAGIIAWGPDVFQPITTEVVARVGYPTICYDCPTVP